MDLVVEMLLKKSVPPNASGAPVCPPPLPPTTVPPSRSGKPSPDGDGTDPADGAAAAGANEVRCFALTLRHGEAYCSQAKTLAAYCTINREVRRVWRRYIPSLGRGRVGQGGSGGEGVVVLLVCLPRRLFGRRGMRDGAERDSRIRSVGENPKKVAGVCCCRQEIQGRSSGLFSSTTANFHKREPPGPHQRPTSRNIVLPRCLMPALLGNPCC